MAASIKSLVPVARVADMERSIDFYKKLRFTLDNSLRHETSGRIFWAFMTSGRAEIMFSAAEAPINKEKQRILLYFYTDALADLRAHYVSQELSVSEITFPFYMPGGEMELEDPDGYRILIAQI